MRPTLEVEVLHANRPNSETMRETLRFLDSLELSPLQHDPRWGEVYHTLDNECFVVALAREGKAITGVSTMTIFSGSYGKILHANPYMGYGGCSVRPREPTAESVADSIRALLKATLDEARAQGCVTATIATPPFTEDLTALYESCLQPDFRLPNTYQFHSLDKHPLTGLTSKRRDAFRSEIRRAEKGGIRIRKAAALEDFDCWLTIYQERYRELGATPIPGPFLRKLWQCFHPTGHAELLLAERDGPRTPSGLLGGTLFLLGRGIADYFSSAFRSDSRNLYPGTLLLDRMFVQLMDQGFRRFNWQSSPNRGGVFAYKKRWGASEGCHTILTCVLGDVAPLRAQSLDAIRHAYGSHFVLPYDLWSTQPPPMATTTISETEEGVAR